MTRRAATQSSFDFRWGVPWLDKARQGGADVPGFILRNYHALGVTPQQMMLVIHLSAYRYNSEAGESRPSLKTISGLMGYAKDASVRALISKLVAKKLVKVDPKPGVCSTYDFSALAIQCLELDQKEQRSLREEVSHPDGGPHADGGLVSHPDGGGVPHSNGTEDQEDKNEKTRIQPSPKGDGTDAGEEVTAPPVSGSHPDEPPAKPKRERKPKKETTPATLFNPMADAVMASFGWKWETASSKEKSKARGAAKELVELGATPDDVPGLFRLCKAKGWDFGPHALLSVWSDYLNKRHAPAPTLPPADMDASINALMLGQAVGL